MNTDPGSGMARDSSPYVDGMVLDLLEYYETFRHEIDVLASEKALFLLAFLGSTGRLSVKELQQHLSWEEDELRGALGQLDEAKLVATAIVDGSRHVQVSPRGSLFLGETLDAGRLQVRRSILGPPSHLVRVSPRHHDDRQAGELDAWLISVVAANPVLRSRTAAREADADGVRDLLREVAAEVIAYLIPDIRRMVQRRTGRDDSETEGQVILRTWRMLATTNLHNQPLLVWAEFQGTPRAMSISDIVMFIAKDRLGVR